MSPSSANWSRILKFIVYSTTLLEVQNNPERFGDLIVPLTGYRAYNPELNKNVQDAIIGRMEQQLI